MQVDEEKLADALKMLTVYSILERTGRNYHFVPQSFQRLLNHTQDVDSLVRIERRKWEKQEGER